MPPEMLKRHREDHGLYAVYRVFGPDGRLLYVGCSMSRWSRLMSHCSSSWWWPYPRDYDLIPALVEEGRIVFTDLWTKDITTARRYESEAIYYERPLANIVGQAPSPCALFESLAGPGFECPDYLREEAA